jgi:hypothetical protein
MLVPLHRQVKLGTKGPDALAVKRALNRKGFGAGVSTKGPLRKLVRAGRCSAAAGFPQALPDQGLLDLRPRGAPQDGRLRRLRQVRRLPDGASTGAEGNEGLADARRCLRDSQLA